MSGDGTPWNELNGAAEARLRPGLAGRVLAEAGRLRAEAAEAGRSRRAMGLCACAAALLLASWHEASTRSVQEQRLAQWHDVATWTGEFAAND
jgi:hypothetical protein